jgi:DNA-directed RNA polymerase subunit RPC12/RpoP
MEFACGSCKTRLQVAAEQAGQYVTCSACGAQVLVPGPSGEIKTPSVPPKPRTSASGEAPSTSTASAGAKTNKGPTKGAAALDSIKKLDSQVEQAERALIDALSMTEKDDTAAIFLKANYLAGRTKRGLNIEILKGKAAMILTLVFSWFYILVVLWALGSAWQFLPLRKTEFISITLRRRARFSALIPFAIAYFVRLVVGIIVISLLVVSTGCVSVVASYIVNDPTPLMLLALASVIGGLLSFLWCLYCNYTLAKMMRGIDEEALLEYQAVLEYGYPTKVALIKGISSAGLDKQLAGLMTLCDTLSKTEFSPWEQVTLHNARQGFLGRTWAGLKSMVGFS